MTSFSICIPNYNYEKYVEQTVRSALDHPETGQVIFNDNASTDRSVEIVRAIADPRLEVRVNRWNVGFAGNLDLACQGATGDRIVLLSSDDLLNPGALGAYARLADALGDKADRAVFDATADVIDGDGVRTGSVEMNRKLWHGARLDADLSRAVGGDVWRIDAATLLRNSVLLLRSPFQFASTCYSRGLFDSVEGFHAVRLSGPDKFLNWKLLAVADEAFHVDLPLVSYRWHNQNQFSVQTSQRSLRHMTDQYVSTFDTPPEILARAKVDNATLAAAFIEQDVALRGLKLLAEGRRDEAQRGVWLGYAAYPHLARRNRKVRLLQGLLAMGPVGGFAARKALDRAMRRWQQPG
ncbi:glycosyltransferase family 2 protein [Sphingomonas hylomeconis]|uniref:Glycosyltransferase family 2 protein n=1 Tax=Sphingomonas hylomeconis TaxID=1395958 RepID=A0ABV7ST72_9SPHN|nr:glycosyltransferase family 2 protein [Sphingomonas hylomeconis]